MRYGPRLLGGHAPVEGGAWIWLHSLHVALTSVEFNAFPACQPDPAATKAAL